jgi:hypothetical protein
VSTFGGLQVVSAGSTDKLKMLLHGPQGAGKSYLASSIAGLGKTVYVDFIGEHGTQSFEGADWAKNVDVLRPASIVDLEEIYRALAGGAHEYEAVVLDSLTAAQKSAMRFILGYEETALSEIKRGKAGADMRAWGTLLEIMTDVATFWYGLADGSRTKPMHVVMTAQTKALEDDLGETRLYPDVSKGSRSVVMATPSFVGYCDFEPLMNDEGEEELKHVLRLGPSVRYATKWRIPVNKQGKIPATLGLGKSPLRLDKLVQALGIR